MTFKKAETIVEVIEKLDSIILESENQDDSRGFFAVLYKRVTLKVKEEIANNFFDDGERMEKFDVVFANRYLEAYFLNQRNKPISDAWEKAFQLSAKYWPIVLQHLLVGMNAHIGLDLGIVAAEMSKNKDIDELENDFIKINEILSSLVNEIQNDLSEIWPTLTWILHKTKKADDILINFSVELARDDAWTFAKSLVNKGSSEISLLIKARDYKVSQAAKFISNPGILGNIILGIIRLGERGTVKQKIMKLKV